MQKPDRPDPEAVQAAARLHVTQSNFAAAIRACQIAGLNPREIGKVVGLTPVTVRLLINSWGLNR